MIKYIDDGQIARLKRQFFKILNLKKLEMINVTSFMNSTATIDLAIKVYKLIIATSLSERFSCCSRIMLDYFYDNHILRKCNYDKIKDYFYDDSDYSEREEDIDYYYDTVEERIDFTHNFMKAICERYSISIECRNYEDLYYESDINDPVFGQMTRVLIDYSTTSSSEEDEEKEEYFAVFQDDAFCYALIGYEMLPRQLNMLNKVLIGYWDSGVATEAYVENGNTYIILSSSYVCNGQGYTFFAALITLLLEEEN